MIDFFAPTTFAIYLIHENPNIREVLWGKFTFVMDRNISEMIGFIILIPIFLFIIFALVDKIRSLICSLFLRNTKKSIKILKKLEEDLCQK